MTTAHLQLRFIYMYTDIEAFQLCHHFLLAHVAYSSKKRKKISTKTNKKAQPRPGILKKNTKQIPVVTFTVSFGKKYKQRDNE